MYQYRTSVNNVMPPCADYSTLWLLICDTRRFIAMLDRNTNWSPRKLHWVLLLTQWWRVLPDITWPLLILSCLTLLYFTWSYLFLPYLTLALLFVTLQYPASQYLCLPYLYGAVVSTPGYEFAGRGSIPVWAVGTQPTQLSIHPFWFGQLMSTWRILGKVNWKPRCHSSRVSWDRWAPQPRAATMYALHFTLSKLYLLLFTFTLTYLSSSSLSSLSALLPRPP